MTTTALIDGDILVYQAAAKAETFIRWDDNIWTLHARQDQAEVLLDEYITTMFEKSGADDWNITVTKGQIFRHEILPSYKGNRDPRKKPILISHLRDWVLETYGKRARCVPRLEADDVMGIMATGNSVVKGKKVLVSVDKDFKTIPCTYYDYGKDEWHETTEDDANHYWMMQTLTGDATDNYAGCPGFGPVTALKLLPEPEPLDVMWEKVLGAFLKKGLSYEYALTQARCARILRHGDYDFKTKEIKLWTPQSE